MTDKKPTPEQIKKFWKWRGVTEDLKNLFKYAVPKLRDKYSDLEVSFRYYSNYVSCRISVIDKLSQGWKVTSVGQAKTERDALFLAIWEVIK